MNYSVTYIPKYTINTLNSLNCRAQTTFFLNYKKISLPPVAALFPLLFLYLSVCSSRCMRQKINTRPCSCSLVRTLFLAKTACKFFHLNPADDSAHVPAHTAASPLRQLAIFPSVSPPYLQSRRARITPACDLFMPPPLLLLLRRLLFSIPLSRACGCQESARARQPGLIPSRSLACSISFVAALGRGGGRFIVTAKQISRVRAVVRSTHTREEYI